MKSCDKTKLVLSPHLNTHIYLFFSLSFFVEARRRLSARKTIQKNPIKFATKTRSIGGTKLKLINTGRERYFQLVNRTVRYSFLSVRKASSGLLPSKRDKKKRLNAVNKGAKVNRSRRNSANLLKSISGMSDSITL